jgi:Protein of unknown function (DUF2442)
LLEVPAFGLLGAMMVPELRTLMAFADTPVELGKQSAANNSSGEWRLARLLSGHAACQRVLRVVIYDPAYFSEVTVDPEAGTIVWPGGIDLAPEPLYEQAKAPPRILAA